MFLVMATIPPSPYTVDNVGMKWDTKMNLKICGLHILLCQKALWLIII